MTADMDKLYPLTVPPGLYRNGTRYQAKGRWYDANLVRFITGTIQPVGGWSRAVDDAGANLTPLTGVPRDAVAWRLDDGTIVMGFGTTQTLSVFLGGVLHDVTPPGFTPGRVDSDHTAAIIAGGGAPYGVGPYGTGNFGAGSVAAVTNEADVWTLDVFGKYLVGICTSDHTLYVWQAGDGASTAVAAPGAPTGSAVVCTPERYLVVLGSDAGTGGVNVRQLSWASQEETGLDVSGGTIDNVWDASAENTAGDFILTTNGRLMCGKRTTRMTLIWTDCDVWTMTFIGGTLVYGFAQAGDNCGIISRRAAVVVDTQAFWMGHDNFFMYDGFTKALDCDVRDYVFSDFNHDQIEKVWATANSQFGEIWWYYCSKKSVEIDSYVVYNFREQHWTTGKLNRTAGFDAGTTPVPVWLDTAGLVWQHETLQGRDSLAYLESGPIELGDGDTLVQAQRLIPDEKTLGDVELRVYSALYPTDPETVDGPYTLNEPTDVRITARQVRLRFEEVVPTSWRVGTMRLGGVPSSRR